MMADTILRIDYMPIDELQRAKRNPKDHDIGMLDSSMNRFGFTAPMTINETTGRFVAGHGRLDTLQQRKAAGLPPPLRIKEENGRWYAPVIRGLSFDTDEEAEAYLITDNRLGELGGWHDDLLTPMLADLAAADLLDGTGWDQDDLDAMLKQQAHENGTTERVMFDAKKHICPECGASF